MYCKCGYHFCYGCGEKFDSPNHYNCGMPKIDEEVIRRNINHRNKLGKEKIKNKKNLKRK